MNEKQLLKDPDVKPTYDVIKACLNSNYRNYLDFTERLKKHDIPLEWRYYTDGCAWLGKGMYRWTTVRGAKKDVTVFWFSVWDGFFKVTFYISEKFRADVLNLPVSTETKKAINDAKQLGKLKFFPLIFNVDSNKQFDDIFALIDFKRTAK